MKRILVSIPLCVVLLVVVWSPWSASAATACNDTASPSTLAAKVSSAANGSTLCLPAGSYGAVTFTVKRTGVVTLTPADGVSQSQVTINPTFNGAANIRVDGVTAAGARITGTAVNTDIVNSNFTGMLQIETKLMASSGVDIDHDSFVNINPCSGCGKGRVYLPERNDSQPSGVTISNSFFSGGASDGILNGSNGSRILNNEFTNLVQGDPTVNHTDSIQLYGSKNTVVDGNYFHGVEDCIMAPDGVDHETITNNVCVVSGSQFGVTLGSDNGSLVRHNTIPKVGLRCCQQKSGTPAPTGTVIKDNILAQNYREVGTPVEDYNLMASGGTGSHDIKGVPSYVGGSSPSTMAGYALAPGSLGKGAASDGTDMGAALTATDPSPTPTPSPSPTATPSPTPTVAAPTAAFGFTPNSPAPDDLVTFDGTASTCPGSPCSYAWVDDGSDGPGGTDFPLGSGPTLLRAFSSAGTKHVRLTVTDSGGQTGTVEHDVVVAAPTPTPSPTPDPTETPTPAAGCDSACEQAYKDQITDLQAQIDQLRATLAKIHDMSG